MVFSIVSHFLASSSPGWLCRSDSTECFGWRATCSGLPCRSESRLRGRSPSFEFAETAFYPPLTPAFYELSRFYFNEGDFAMGGCGGYALLASVAWRIDEAGSWRFKCSSVWGLGASSFGDSSPDALCLARRTSIGKSGGCSSASCAYSSRSFRSAPS